ncbi:MAG: cation diffusion facilitator family transporter [Bacteroidales bacterium]
MEHEHHHHEVSGKNLWWTILLNLAITLAEGIGGLISGSMALISDAAHNFSDVLSLIISYVANRLTRHKATPAQTYGFKRSEILAAFIKKVLEGYNINHATIQPEISETDSKQIIY